MTETYMANILLIGASGKMGRTVAKCAEQHPETLQIAAGCDVHSDESYKPAFPIYADVDMVKEPVDVIIDFSGPSALRSVLAFAKKKNIGAVLAATGYDDDEKQLIREASSDISIFHSANLSIGINLLKYLAKEATRIIGETSDIEIVERHHNLKVDSPSGTALALADAVAEELPGSMEFVYGRHGKDDKRQKNEIGIHSVRGGTIVGDHEVMFIRQDEEVSLTHHAYSKEIFAQGALQAADFLLRQSPGLYDMESLITERDLLSK